MKNSFKSIFVAGLILTSFTGFGQTSGSITVDGDFDKFYPVTWLDGNWYNNRATELEIGRSDVHTNSNWRGSLIAQFSFHTTRWGHGSSYINAFIKNYNGSSVDNKLIAGWKDATGGNSSSLIIIWLRGGGTTYYFNGNCDVTPTVYDGVQNTLPYQEISGPAETYKTSIDPYVNFYGNSYSGNAFFNGGGTNYFLGNVGIGTITPREKLSVNGKIRAQEIKVETANWPDYVFDENYNFSSLPELEKYIKANKHLPEIPSAEETEQDGISLGEMNAKLLKKIEELTLHMIEKDKAIEELKTLMQKSNDEIDELSKRINLLEKVK